jgi:hypothetical protein
MKTANLILILIVITTILIVPAHAKRDTTSLPEDIHQPLIGRPHPELAGIDRLYVGIAINKQYVGVTPDIDDPQKNGFVWKELETRVMNKLLESDIKVVGNIKTAITVGLNISEISELRVDIDMLKLSDSQQYVFHTQTFLSRNVVLKHQPSLGLKADVWGSDPVMQAVSVEGIPTTITNEVLEQIDAFIADYRTANPLWRKTTDTNDISAVLPVVVPRQTTPVIKPPTAEYKYVASKNSKVFHKPDCPWAQKIKPANLVTFSTREQAIAAGKRPCKQCQP